MMFGKWARGAIRQFQFREYTDSNAGVNGIPVHRGRGRMRQGRSNSVGAWSSEGSPPTPAVEPPAFRERRLGLAAGWPTKPTSNSHRQNSRDGAGGAIWLEAGAAHPRNKTDLCKKRSPKKRAARCNRQSALLVIAASDEMTCNPPRIKPRGDPLPSRPPRCRTCTT
jgi:hypothetical protein